MNINFEAIEKAWGKPKKDVLNELEEYLKENIKITKNALKYYFLYDDDIRKYKRDIALFEMVLDKIQELKKEKQ